MITHGVNLGFMCSLCYGFVLSFAVECKATFTQEVFTADEEIVLKVFLRYSEVECVCAPFSCVYKGVRALYGLLHV